MKLLASRVNTNAAPSVDTSMRTYVCLIVALGALAAGCGGAEFQEELFDEGTPDAPASAIDAPHEDNASVTDALGPDSADETSSDANTPTDAGSANVDACDCVCLATTIGSVYCDGGTWAGCTDTEAGPSVRCVY